MADMKIRPDEITSILKQRIEGLDEGEADLSEVGVVLFGEWDKIEEGDTVKRTGKLLEIPVGEGLLGRIVDPLGNPLDGKGDVDIDGYRPAEFKAPGVVQRQPVVEPMLTGVKAIDSMTAIGLRQRGRAHVG